MQKSYGLIVASFLSLMALGLRAQDQHFTQFYAAPLYLNPALTGTFDGKYRASMIYRDQGRNLLNDPLTTYSAAIDFRFDMANAGKSGRDAAGLGMVFVNDRSASLNFYNNIIGISGAYHKSLSRFGEQYLSLGGQLSIGQRNINYGNINFDDQFNGTDGFTDPTGEQLPDNNFGYGDVAVGLNYTYAPEGRFSVFAGGAMHHVLRPEASFYAREEIQEERNSSRLFRKYSAYVNLQYPLSDKVQFSPRALAYLQGPHFALNAGANLRFLMSDVSGTAFHVGGWVRPVRNSDSKFSPDALILMTGLEYNNFLIGLSYDARLGSLNTTGRRLGALEISLAFLGNYENSSVLCPKF
jgi:type IX secretion system PorP/SprF family membrane protein